MRRVEAKKGIAGWEAAAVGLILIAAFALRVVGLRWGLPDAHHYFSYHPDEAPILYPAMGMIRGDWNPHFFNYGTLYLYIVGFFSTSFVASIGDAAGSVFGKRFGKHKLPGGTKKSWEGLAAGMLVSFTAVLVVNLAFDPAGWIAAIAMAAAVAGCAGLFDAKVTRVDDNYMNTFVLGAIAWVLYLLLHA